MKSMSEGARAPGRLNPCGGTAARPHIGGTSVSIVVATKSTSEETPSLESMLKTLQLMLSDATTLVQSADADNEQSASSCNASRLWDSSTRCTCWHLQILGTHRWRHPLDPSQRARLLQMEYIQRCPNLLHSMTQCRDMRVATETDETLDWCIFDNFVQHEIPARASVNYSNRCCSTRVVEYRAIDCSHKLS